MYKLILAFSLFGICWALSEKFSLKYKKRRDFFSSLASFNRDYKTSVNFRRDNIGMLLEKKYQSCYFNNLLKEKIFSKGRKIDFNFPEFIDENEAFELNNYFNSLGKSDADTELILLDEYQDIFKKKFEKSEEENRKNSVLIRKTGLIIGLIAFVVAV